MDRSPRERRTPRRKLFGRALGLSCALFAVMMLGTTAHAGPTLNYDFTDCYVTASDPLVPVDDFSGVKQESGAAAVRVSKQTVWIFTSAQNEDGSYAFTTPGFETPDSPGSNGIPTITCTLDGPLTPIEDPLPVTGFFTPQPKG
jgi:hypothetical protein